MARPSTLPLAYHAVQSAKSGGCTFKIDEFASTNYVFAESIEVNTLTGSHLPLLGLANAKFGIRFSFGSFIPFLRLIFAFNSNLLGLSCRIVNKDVLYSAVEGDIASVLKECDLEEARFGPTLSPEALSLLSRQKKLKKLSIGAGNCRSSSLNLSAFPELEDLELEEVTEKLAREIEQHGSNLIRLKLGGSLLMISSIRRSLLPSVKEFGAKISGTISTSIFSNIRRDSESILQSTTTLSLDLDNTWTNQTLASYLCPMTSLISLAISVTDLTWFAIPNCLGSMPLQILTLSKTMKPDLATLPATLTMLTVFYSKDASTLTLLDWSLINSFPALKSLDLSGSGFTGTAPSCFGALQSVLLPYNAFYGPLSPDLFSCSPSLTIFVASRNQLNGTIPWYGLGAMTHLDLSSNAFTHLPPFDLQRIAPRNTAPTSLASFSVGSNPLVQWPDQDSFNYLAAVDFLNFDCPEDPALPRISPRPFPITNTTIVTKITAIYMSGCPITEWPQLEFPNSNLAQVAKPYRTWDFHGSMLSGSIPPSIAWYTWHHLDLGSNVGINGTFPSNWYGSARLDSGNSVLDPNTFVYWLDLSNTSISGNFTLDTSQYITNFFRPGQFFLNFSDMPFLDFCAQESPTWTMSARNCDLRHTNAFECQNKYSNLVCLFADPEQPQFAPLEPQPSPIAAVGTTCPAPRPSVEFICVNGTWFSPTPVFSPSIIVPPSAAVLINGSLFSNTITFLGFNSVVVVRGCVDGLKQIQIQLTQADVEKLEKSGSKGFSHTLIESSATDGSTSCPSLDGIQVSLSKQKFGCKRVVAIRDSTSTKTNLSVVFRLDKSKCNLWWIILVSVICALTIIGVITSVLAYRAWRAKKMSSAVLRSS